MASENSGPKAFFQTSMVKALMQTVFVQKVIDTSIDFKSKLFILGKPFEQSINSKYLPPAALGE